MLASLYIYIYISLYLCASLDINHTNLSWNQNRPGYKYSVEISLSTEIADCVFNIWLYLRIYVIFHTHWTYLLRWVCVCWMKQIPWVTLWRKEEIFIQIYSRSTFSLLFFKLIAELAINKEKNEESVSLSLLW